VQYTHLQNGLGNLEALSDCISPHQLLGGVTAQGATLLGPGQVRHAGEGQTVIGPGLQKDVLAQNAFPIY